MRWLRRPLTDTISARAGGQNHNSILLWLFLCSSPSHIETKVMPWLFAGRRAEQTLSDERLPSEHRPAAASMAFGDRYCPSWGIVFSGAMQPCLVTLQVLPFIAVSLSLSADLAHGKTNRPF